MIFCNTPRVPGPLGVANDRYSAEIGGFFTHPIRRCRTRAPTE